MLKKSNFSGPSQKKMTFSELFDRYWYLLIIAGILIAVAIGGVIVYNHFQENAYQKQLILGDKYLEEGKYKESILAFDSAIHIKDKNPAAYRRKAAVYASSGDTKALTRLVKTYPTYFINYSLTKTSKSTNSQNYSLNSKPSNSQNYSLFFPDTSTPALIERPNSEFEDSVVALSSDAKGKNKYSVDMDLIGANTDGGKIYYTTDGTKPTEKSKAYQKPIEIEVKDDKHPVTIKAFAQNDKKEQTAVSDTTLKYSDIKAPSIETKKDEKNEGKFTVTIKCDEKNAEIYYTTDGKDPSKKSEQYKKPLTIDVKEGETKTIKAVSVLKDKTSSPVTSTIARDVKKDNDGASKDKSGDKQTKEEQAAEKKVFVVMPTIVISQDAQNAAAYHVNILTATEGNKIYYTKDGKDPTVKSTAYKDAFTVKAKTGETITIKAIAVDKNGNVSDIAKQEETPVVVDIPKGTDQKESEKKDSDTKEKQTKDTKDDSSKKDDTNSSDAMNTDSKNSDSTTTKDKTASSDSNKDTSLKDDSLPTVPKETQGKESNASDSGSGSTKNDSSTNESTTSDNSNTTSSAKSGSAATSDTTDADSSSTSSKSDSGSSAKTPAPSTSAPVVSAAPAVNLTAPVLEKSKSQSGSGVKIEWKPVTGADGYEYHYENGTFIDEKTITTTTYEAIKDKEANSTAFTLKVRAYHTEGGKKTYSDWSTVYQGSFGK